MQSHMQAICHSLRETGYMGLFRSNGSSGAFSRYSRSEKPKRDKDKEVEVRIFLVAVRTILHCITTLVIQNRYTTRGNLLLNFNDNALIRFVYISVNTNVMSRIVLEF